MGNLSRLGSLFFAAALAFAATATHSFAQDSSGAGKEGSRGFVFRYKSELVGVSAGESDGVCEEGEDPASPDCVADGGDDDAEAVETVDGVPDWDDAWIGEVDGVTPLRIEASGSKSDVGSSKVIYQCFKAYDGYGNYNWWIYDVKATLPGFDAWAERVDIVSRSDLGKPLVNSEFDSDGWMVPMAPAAASGRLGFTDEACVRIQVKKDAIPADDVVVNVMVDDYADEDVVGGTVPGENFWTAESAADFTVRMKPNCTSKCYPEDDGTPKVDAISIVTGPESYGYDLDWNYSTNVTRADDVFYRCVKADGAKPYYFWQITYDPSQQDPAYGGWIKAWDVVPRSQLSSPVATSHVPESLGDYSWLAYYHPASTSDEACIRVKADVKALPAEGVRMEMRVTNTDNADGSLSDPDPDAVAPWRWRYVYINTACKYGCRPPSEDRVKDGGFTFEKDPNFPDKVVSGEGLSPLIVTPTTRQNHGDMLYQCFAISGGFGNYQSQTTQWDSDAATWQDGYDIVGGADVSRPMNEAELSGPQFYPSYYTYGDTTTENSFCVRVRPRQDGVGNRSAPLRLMTTVVDTRTPNDGWSPDQENYQSTMFFVSVTPDLEQKDNDGDGVCKFGETGSDCDGLCYPGEEGSSDCVWQEDPLFEASSIHDFGLYQTGKSFSFPGPEEEPVQDAVLFITRATGLASERAVTYAGKEFSYQCFDASGGPWPNWTYSLDLNRAGGGYGWLKNADLVPQSDLYSGAVLPVESDFMRANYPLDPTETTTSTRVCMRWIAQQPAAGEQQEMTFNLFASNFKTADATTYSFVQKGEGKIVP